jgi:hypothetical protein
MTITEQPSRRDHILASFESSKAPSSPIIPVGRVMGPVLYRPASANVPCQCVSAKWQGGTEGKLRSSNRGLDVAHRGTKNSTRNNVRGEHSYVV